MRYYKSIRSEVQKENSEMKSVDIARLCAEKWRSLGDKDRN